jgi:TatD DNase family protein
VTGEGRHRAPDADSLRTLGGMWIDTHCHLDADEFDADRDAVVERARAAGVSMVVMPTGHIAERDKAAEVARKYGFAYALGIHPLWLGGAQPADVERLREMMPAALDDPRFVAIGEIGIDLHEPGLDPERQQWFYREQLKVARDFGVPVIVHVRQSADLLLKHLRAIDVPGGIIHAFNGSEQQAGQFLARGFRLGFGGALTYAGSQRIRRHARQVPDDGWVLETDAPYIPPQWLRDGGAVGRNEPVHLARIAQELATLRGVSLDALAARNRANAAAALPRLGAWLAASNT